ncbi:leucine-rich repeat-containing protein 72 [Pristis pectinata]|uniref:leucine-rich repeat-containing protein 72 n=1 Tax=Pristis pectinata TaxID=685728 RepID=UPI00223E7FC8|nr:leucine-rich repeat-containing protein 72 [Pristis pectinata]
MVYFVHLQACSEYCGVPGTDWALHKVEPAEQRPTSPPLTIAAGAPNPRSDITSPSNGFQTEDGGCGGGGGEERRRGLTEVPDLSRFKQLKYLWLNHNKIKKISSLKMNYCLKELYLQNNLLTDLTGTLKHLTSLQILMLHNNWLTKLEKVVAELKKLRWLHTLNQDYRLYVIYHLPSVQLLDRQYILQRERDAALGFCNQDQMRIRQSVAFGQRIQTHLLKQTAPKRSNYIYPVD